MLPWAALAVSLVAGAERPAVALKYVGGPECPDEAAFRALLAARLGFDPVAPEAAVRATVRLGPELGQLVFEGAMTGERTLRAADCGTLATSMALALAIAIDPQLYARKPAPPVVSAVAVEPAPAEPPGTPVGVMLAVGPRLALGLLPAGSGGLAVDVVVRRGLLSFGLTADGAIASSYGAQGGSIAASAFRASLAACANIDFLGVCARASAGVLRAEGSGFANARLSTLPLLSVGPLVRAGWNPWKSLWLGASVGLDVPLLRVALTLGDVEIWRAAAVSVDLGVFVGWALL